MYGHPLKMVLLTYLFIIGLTLVKISDGRQISETPLENDAIDCAFGPWGEFDKCTETCGGGYKTRWRDVLIEAQFGGKQCQERLYDTMMCNTDECPLPAIATLDEIGVLLDRKMKPIQDAMAYLESQVSNMKYDLGQKEDAIDKLDEYVEEGDSKEGLSSPIKDDSETPYQETGILNLDGGYWGTWGTVDKCTYPAFVNAMELKFENTRSTGFDDTALNGVRLTCSDGHTISSTVGPWGNWKGRKTCSGKNYITRAIIRRERQQGSGDDTAANGLRFECSDGEEHYPYDGNWGDWSTYLSCPEGSAVMGIQTQEEKGQGKSFDDTALNDVRLYCAKYY